MRLKDYIQGNRRGKEANRMEREAMNDPFLQEALDGFDAVAGDHLPIIERLEKKFTKPTPRNRIVWYWSAAASILLLVGISAYFFLERTEKTTPVIAMHQPVESEEIALKESMTSPLLQAREQQPATSMPQRKTVVTELARITEVPESDEEVIVNMVADNVITDDVAVAAAKVVAAQPEVKIDRNRLAVFGKVLDETGEPIPGVTIVERGTTTGTVTDLKGTFALQVATDSSKLMASFVGYKPQEIIPSGDEQTVVLEESDLPLDEVIIVGYAALSRRTVTDAVSAVSTSEPVRSTFGEKEFQAWCRQEVDKNVCEGRGVSVKMIFFIDESGKPTKIRYQKYTCEDAKTEMEKLLSASPAWTQTNRKVSMTIEW